MTKKDGIGRLELNGSSLIVGQGHQEGLISMIFKIFQDIFFQIVEDSYFFCSLSQVVVDFEVNFDIP